MPKAGTVDRRAVIGSGRDYPREDAEMPQNPTQKQIYEGSLRKGNPPAGSRRTSKDK